MEKGRYLTTLLQSPKTVLTVKDILLLWQERETDAARVRLNYYVKKGNLIRLRRGLYGKNKDYNKLELATRIHTPSYVSFETVLAKEGLIFQYQTGVTIASYLSRTIIIEDETYSFKKMRNTLLTNPSGVKQVDETSIATKERAFLDILYINKDFHFDNTRSLNWQDVFAMLPLYNNKRMSAVVASLYKESQK